MVAVKQILRPLVTVLLVPLFISCFPGFDNPFDPEGDKPLPLAPRNIALSSPEKGAVRVTFAYEYASNAKIRIKRKEVVIAIMTSGTEFTDYTETPEDVSIKYKLTGYNDFGSTDAPECLFDKKVPPRVSILSVVNDTVTYNKVTLYGTVWDSSNVDIFSINNESISLDYLGPYYNYAWMHTLTLNKGMNKINIYTKDKSPCASDTTILLEIFYLSGNRAIGEQLLW